MAVILTSARHGPEFQRSSWSGWRRENRLRFLLF
jgi:hypothetical protein